MCALLDVIVCVQCEEPCLDFVDHEIEVKPITHKGCVGKYVLCMWDSLDLIVHVFNIKNLVLMLSQSLLSEEGLREV